MSDLLAAVRQRVKLSKRNSLYVGLCPFHDERTPSFTVWPERDSWYCFGCKAGGNLDIWHKRVNGFSVADERRIKREKTGGAMANPPRMRPPIDYDFNKKLCDCWYDGLSLSSHANEAHRYMWSRGVDFLSKAAVALDLGYDKATSSLVWPLKDDKGVVGFCKQNIAPPDESMLPKYVMSRNLPKGELLLGYTQALPFIQSLNQVVIVEGNWDVLQLHNAGICNVVGLMGTSLSYYNRVKLLGLTKNFVLALDGDKAGRFASKVIENQLLKHGAKVTVVELPEGEDPDSFVRKWRSQ